MAAATEAKVGYWTDHSRRLIDRPQILVTDFWALFLTSIVAVCFTLTSPYNFIILKSLLLWAFGYRKLIRAESHPPDERTPLLNGHIGANAGSSEVGNDEGEQSHEESALVLYREDEVEVPPSPPISQSIENDQDISISHLAAEDNILLRMLSDSESSRDFLWKCTKYVRRGGRRQASAITVIILVLFGVFLGWSAVGVLSARMASDRTGLSSSRACGIWQFDDNAGDEAAYRDDLYNRRKEERASQYSETCYNNPNPTDTLACRIFYNQSIGFETKTRQQCPFSSAELCFEGLYSAISFDTGMVGSSVIGINSPVTFKFRRRTTCSPLNMSEPYITRNSQGAVDTNYYYNYGSLDDASYTFNTSGHPFEWLVPVYSANAEFSSLYPDYDYWHPIPELQRPAGSTLTIIFVSSLHIFHVFPSIDSIFPANQRRRFQGSYEDYFYNSDPRARPVACVDTSEVCSADGQQCWTMRDVVPPDMFSDPTFWLMKWSLENSNIYDSLGWRLGAALLAQKQVSQSISTPLPANQWEIEATQLFATSLARIQYDAWGIAVGEDRERPGYLEVTPDEARGKLCGFYKFKTADYTNVNLVAFLGYILLSFAIYLMSWEVLWKEDGTEPSKVLVIEAMLMGLASLVKRIRTGVSEGLRYLSRKETHENIGSVEDRPSHAQ